MFGQSKSRASSGGPAPRKGLNAKRKRALFLYAGIGAIVIIAWALSRPGVLTQQNAPVNAKNLLGSANSHALGVASINNQVAQQSQEIAALKREITRRVSAQTPGSSLAGSAVPVPVATAVPPPPVPVPVPSPTGGAVAVPYAQVPPSGQAAALAAMAAPSIETIGGPAAASSSTATPNAGATSPAKRKVPKIFLPAGTMLTGVLLTGLDAPTGRNASSEPIPVLVRIKEDAILPNEYRADFRECFIVASGIGDLSSERAYLRGQYLSCVRRDGGVIQAHVQMWGTGSDGFAGLRGTLVSKQGTAIARALMAGFAAGIGQAFTPQQQTVISANGSPYQSLPLGVAGRMAAFGGISSAANQVAAFYLKMAESEFPVIEVSAGQPVTFIVEKGASIPMLKERTS